MVPLNAVQLDVDPMLVQLADVDDVLLASCCSQAYRLTQCSLNTWALSTGTRQSLMGALSTTAQARPAPTCGPRVYAHARPHMGVPDRPRVYTQRPPHTATPSGLNPEAAARPQPATQ